MSTIEVILTRSFKSLIPPPRLNLSEWAERNIVLPVGDNAAPGKLRLYPYQKSIADAISDIEIERITLLKATRIGFSLLVTAAIASFIANDPSAILLLLPTENDARDSMVSQLEPIFEASPALNDLLSLDETDRNTLLSRRFPGGSLKLVAAKAPRNLRRHTAKILLIDEADAMTETPEGNPIALAEQRTLTFKNRKIILGSTPTFEESSHVVRAYNNSDQRVFEVPCIACGGFHEIEWADIRWSEGEPEKAQYKCPQCEELIDEKHKHWMVEKGEWRITKPEVTGHAGFRLNSLVSQLPHSTWPKLAAEFLAAKNDVSLLQVFTNCVLAQPWSTPSMIDEKSIAARAEQFSINLIPSEVLVITIGADVQDDRIECSVCGWTRTGDCLVLDHVIIWGSFTDAGTFDELETLLRSTWKHPWGGNLKVDGAVIDCSDGDHFDYVMNFCTPKISRRVFPGKGMFGTRPGFAMSKGKTVGNRMAIIGVDTLKSKIFDMLQHGRGVRFSYTLEPVYFEQLASERRVVKYKMGMPTRRFERIGSARAESLDCLVYATAARQSFNITFDRREAELREQPLPRKSIASQLARGTSGYSFNKRS